MEEAELACASVSILQDQNSKGNMDVSKNKGTPKWMVYRENPIKMDFSETPI